MKNSLDLLKSHVYTTCTNNFLPFGSDKIHRCRKNYLVKLSANRRLSIAMAARSDLDHSDHEEWSKPNSIRIELEGGSDLKTIAQTLIQNSTVKDIEICIHHTFTQTARLDMGCTLRGLRRLEFYPGTGNYNVYQIEALGSALRLAPELETLYVYHLELSGDDESFCTFARQLQRCENLKEVCFIDCQIESRGDAENQSSNTSAFDPVIEVLGKLPALKVAAVWFNDLGGLSKNALANVCGSTTIERLMILGFYVNRVWDLG
jgi:hypothetical protein